MKSKRIWELDFLRGFAILMMVFDHLMYDLNHMPYYFSSNFYTVDNQFFNDLTNLAGEYWTSGLRFWGHHFFVAVFLLVSGISFTFSKNNLARSLKMLVVALIISAVTIVISLIQGNIGMLILMGIIHMFGLSTLITYFLRKFIKSDLVILFIGIAIIIWGISFEFWKYPSQIPGGSLPQLIDIPGMIIGTNAFGADYFGIVPMLGVILIGTVIGNQLYSNKTTLFPQIKVGERNVICLAGRYSIYVYVLHQVILFVLMFVVAYIFGYRM